MWNDFSEKLKTGVLVFIFLSSYIVEAQNIKPSPTQVDPKASKNSVAPTASKTSTKMMVQGKYLHLSCNKSIRDLNNNKLQCFGNVYIRRPSELMTSDYAVLDLTTETLEAEGNIVYFTPDTVVYGKKMKFNLKTETGVIEEGRVEGDRYQLIGDRLERRSQFNYYALDGEYTTCLDCPASWKIRGKSIDLTFDGYARLSNVFIKIKESPLVYLPYFIFPVKTRRQSGLLYPKISPVSQNGFMFVQPLFLALSKNLDATIGLGAYSLRGQKAEGEFRYVLNKDMSGQINAYFLKDRSFQEPYNNRWALQYVHSYGLPFGINHKLNYVDVFDRDYIRFIGDVPGHGEPGLLSEASISKSSSLASVWVSGKRIRNLITPGLVGFDHNTVQVAPQFGVRTPPKAFHDSIPLYWSTDFRYTHFWRLGPSFDYYWDEEKDPKPPAPDFYLPGVTPVRRAQRFQFTPQLFSSLKAGDFLELVPSVQYRTFYYLFDQNVVAPLPRGYLVAQADASTTIEKVYDAGFKHKFRPSLTYSNIPIIQQNLDHGFIQQLRKSGYQFDDLDIVPISYESQLYFVPLGNSLSYSLGNKFITKQADEHESKKFKYIKAVDLSLGQSINFIEFRKSAGDSRQPLSRFFSFLSVDTLRVKGRGEFYYYPYQGGSTLNIGASYIFAQYQRRTLQFERSINLGYNFNQVTANSSSVSAGTNWSINDYFGVQLGTGYFFPSTKNSVKEPGRISSMNAGLVFQSPSQCYKVVVAGNWSFESRKVNVSYSIPINLTGDGFMDVQNAGSFAPPGSR